MLTQAPESVRESIARFSRSIARAVDELRTQWATRQQVDVTEYMLDVLAYRNFDLVESIHLLVANNRTLSAELLIRPLFEGTVVFEWCSRKVPDRILRFRRTSFEDTLDLIDRGHLKRSSQQVENLRESLRWLDRQGYRRLPPLSQILDDVEAFAPGKARLVHKHFSRLLHGAIEGWSSYLTPRGSDPEFRARLG
jgi:hypothetical protein